MIVENKKTGEKYIVVKASLGKGEWPDTHERVVPLGGGKAMIVRKDKLKRKVTR